MSFVKESSGSFLDKYTNPSLSQSSERLLQNVSRQMVFPIDQYLFASAK